MIVIPKRCGVVEGIAYLRLTSARWWIRRRKKGRVTQEDEQVRNVWGLQNCTDRHNFPRGLWNFGVSVPKRVGGEDKGNWNVSKIKRNYFLSPIYSLFTGFFLTRMSGISLFLNTFALIVMTLRWFSFDFVAKFEGDSRSNEVHHAAAITVQTRYGVILNKISRSRSCFRLKLMYFVMQQPSHSRHTMW